MSIEGWLRKKAEEFKNDPEYLKEYIDLLEGELDAVKQIGLKLAHDIAREAHMMGRIYGKGGEKESPMQVSNQLEIMVGKKVREAFKVQTAACADSQEEQTS